MNTGQITVTHWIKKKWATGLIGLKSMAEGKDADADGQAQHSTITKIQ